MELVVHQAIFGENRNRHATLCSSLNDKDLLDQLEFSTDRPLSTGQWSPYTSGYPIRQYYVLLRIAPDKRARSQRGGWRIAHALIFQRQEVAHWNNLMQLIHLLPENPTRLETVLPLKLLEGGIDDAPVPLAFPKLVSLLVKPKRIKRTLIWVGNEGYLEAVHSLWRNLWPSARMDVTFTYSYRPQDVDSHFAFVSTPVEYIDQWREYDVIRGSEAHEPSSEVERLLLGRGNIQSLETFVQVAGVEQITLSKIGLIYQAYEYYSTPGWEDSLEIVRPFARLLAQLVPDSGISLALKTRIFERLCWLTIHGTVTDILALRNFDPTPFHEQDETLSSVMKTWATGYFASLNMAHASDIAQLLEGRQPANRKHWNESINQILHNILMMPSSWSTTIAEIIWNIWIKNHSLVTETASFFGNGQSIEDHLVGACPAKITEALGKVVCALAINKNWFRLHAAVLAGYADIHTAFQQQKRIDTRVTYIDGIRELAARYSSAKSPETVLEILEGMGDTRSYFVGGELCAKYPSLLQRLDLSTAAGVEIWLNAVNHEESLLETPAASSKVVHKLFDIWLDGRTVRKSIFERLARTQHSDLTEYARRPQVWEPLKSLSYNLAYDFLSSTARGWLTRFKKGQNWGIIVEDQLADAIKTSPHLRDLLASYAPDGIPLALSLFSCLPNKLKAWEFEEWFLAQQLNRRVTGEDAALVGKFIAENGWAFAAKKLAKHLDRKPQSNWTFALDECHNLLAREKGGFFPFPFWPGSFEPTYNNPVRYPSGTRSKKMMNVLFLATNPTDTARLRLDKEHRTIVERLRSAQVDKVIRMEMRGAVRPNDLQEYLLQFRPQVVHFSGHGDLDGRILLENETGTHQPVPIEALTNLFGILKDQVRVILINACWSQEQAKALVTHIDYVIGMSRSIGDESAIRFAEGFYRGLGYGLPVKQAFALGKNNLELHNHLDSDVPQILIRPGVDEGHVLFNPTV